MSEKIQPGPTLRKAISILLLGACLWALWAIYVRSTEPSPSITVELPLGTIMILLGLRFWTDRDDWLSRPVARSFSVASLATGVFYFIRFFVER